MSLKKILLAILYLFLISFSIYLTPKEIALSSDANNYFLSAQKILSNGILVDYLGSSPSFGDKGYPMVMAIIMSLFGHENIFIFQLINYVFWLLSVYFIYKSLKILKSKFINKATLLALFSPVYLTFSAKLYSESFASLGTSLLIFGTVSALKNNKKSNSWAIIIGSLTLFSTKSVFLLMLIPLLITFLMVKNKKAVFAVILAIFLLLPNIISSSGGKRSEFNLAIQSSKVQQNYGEIIACSVYYLSYPLGQTALPNYWGTCHQNNPSEDMPGYDQNPYVLAAEKRVAGFTTLNWFSIITNNLFKYLLIIVVSMFNIILIEGIYPSILLQLPQKLLIILFSFKIILSIYIWKTVFYNLSKIFKRNKRQFLVFSMPLVYFFIVVGNFPIEQRYFYPLIPYLYFLVGLDEK